MAMALLDGYTLSSISPLKNALDYTGRSIEIIVERFRKFISQVIPPLEVDIREVKKEIWAELSAVYYKYEDGHQKRAFREVAQEISQKMQEGNWEAVYKKLYRIEHKSPHN
jgi:hypothetical protein